MRTGPTISDLLDDLDRRYAATGVASLQSSPGAAGFADGGSYVKRASADAPDFAALAAALRAAPAPSGEPTFDDLYRVKEAAYGPR